MTHHRIEPSQERRVSPVWAITIAILCLTGTLGCSLARLFVEPLVAAVSPQEAPKNPALATRTPCPTFTPIDVPVTPAPTLNPEATPTPLPAACVAPPVALLPGGADTPKPAPGAQPPIGTEADRSELAPAEADPSELAPAEADPSELALAEADPSELAPAEADTSELALAEGDTSEVAPAEEADTPEPAPSDTATPKPKPKPTPTATRRPAVKAAAVPPTETPTPTITPTPTPKFAYNAVEIYSASTTNAFLTGYIMIVNADDIPIGGVKAVGSFDPGGARYESSLSKWFFEGYSAPGPVLKTSSVKFEPPGGIQKGTWFIHLESEQGARLSDDVTIVTDPAKPEWFFVEFKQPGPRSTPTPTPEWDWEATQTAEAEEAEGTPTATPKPGTPTATPKPGTPTVTPKPGTPQPTATKSGTWHWPH